MWAPSSFGSQDCVQILVLLCWYDVWMTMDGKYVQRFVSGLSHPLTFRNYVQTRFANFILYATNIKFEL